MYTHAFRLLLAGLFLPVAVAALPEDFGRLNVLKTLYLDMNKLSGKSIGSRWSSPWCCGHCSLDADTTPTRWRVLLVWNRVQVMDVCGLGRLRREECLCSKVVVGATGGADTFVLI